MTALVPFLNGVVLAGAFAALVRAAPARHRLRLHAGMLLLAAVLYVVFAARAGAWHGAGVEAVGAAFFGGAAVLGVRRRRPAWLVLGWALHPVWDVALHTAGPMASYTPGGYVAACLGFDLLLAAVIARGGAE